MYRCSIIINNSGSWSFVAFVNLPTGETGQKQLQVLETTLDFDNAVAVERQFKALRQVVEGSSRCGGGRCSRCSRRRPWRSAAAT